jgi:hypothetical protein
MPNLVPEAKAGYRELSEGIDATEEPEAFVFQGPDVDEAALVSRHQNLGDRCCKSCNWRLWLVLWKQFIGSFKVLTYIALQ